MIYLLGWLRYRFECYIVGITAFLVSSSTLLVTVFRLSLGSVSILLKVGYLPHKCCRALFQSLAQSNALTEKSILQFPKYPLFTLCRLCSSVLCIMAQRKPALPQFFGKWNVFAVLIFPEAEPSKNTWKHNAMPSRDVSWSKCKQYVDLAICCSKTSVNLEKVQALANTAEFDDLALISVIMKSWVMKS